VTDFLSAGKIRRNTVAVAESLGIGTGCSVVCDEIIVAIAIDGQKKVTIRLPRHIPADAQSIQPSREFPGFCLSKQNYTLSPQDEADSPSRPR
jgi:hypothetical protein